MFPIVMPYMPPKNRYKIYTQTFLTDRKNGDFDTHALLYVITPDGDRIDLNIYETERDGQWARITKEEYDALLEKRIDKLSRKVAEHLLWTLIYNCEGENVTNKRIEAFGKKSQEEIERYHAKLTELCKFFENPDNYQYNTFGMIQHLCKGYEHGNLPSELVKIEEYLVRILIDLGV